jgi:hypothetical protein
MAAGDVNAKEDRFIECGRVWEGAEREFASAGSNESGYTLTL